MRGIALLIGITFLLSWTPKVKAEDPWSQPPAWEAGDHWTYRSNETRQGRNIISTFDIWVAQVGSYRGKQVYFVEHLGNLRSYPVIIGRDEPRRVWTVYDTSLVPMAWMDPILSDPSNARYLVFASVDEWRPFDWPLTPGKKWQGKARLQVGDSTISDEWSAEVISAEPVTVAAGTFQTMLVLIKGRLTQNGRSATYEERLWFSREARNIAKLTLKFSNGDALTSELVRYWR